MYRFLLPLVVVLPLAACDTPPLDTDPPELITEVILTLTPTAGGAPFVITASDPDGDGADLAFAPARLTIPEGIYTGSLELRDIINSEDITEEVEEEAEEHLFRYTLSPANAGQVAITDSESDYTAVDQNGGDFAVGLAFELAVAGEAAGDGVLNVTLFHFDEAPKPSSTATSDEIDIDVDFPVSFGTVVTAR